MANIKYPLKLNQINATNVNLLYRKIKTDTTHARVNINNGSLSIENISNINAGHPLSVSASASLEDKVPFKLSIDFDYQKPQFNLNGSFAKFDLVDLSPLLGSFAPVAVKSGNVEKIEFSGIASKTEAIGTMTFLYDDLKVDIDLEDKAKWKSAILSFAANTVISSANPAKEDIPPRVVQYQVERDMNKGFFNILLKSVLSGLKESVIMSKDNKKRYKEVKKDGKLESKK